MFNFLHYTVVSGVERTNWQPIVGIVFGILDAIGLIFTLVGVLVDQLCWKPLNCKYKFCHAINFLHVRPVQKLLQLD